MDGHFCTYVISNTPELELTKCQTAAYSRHLPIVKYLLNAGVDTEAGDVDSR